MAISLDDIKKTRIGKSKQKDLPKKKPLRPWENFSTSRESAVLSKKAPSYSEAGSLAVKRAREIVAKNSHMITEMRKRGHLHQDSSLKKEPLPDNAPFKDPRSMTITKKKKESYKIKSKQGFLGIIKEIFNH